MDKQQKLKKKKSNIQAEIKVIYVLATLHSSEYSPHKNYMYMYITIIVICF